MRVNASRNGAPAGPTSDSRDGWPRHAPLNPPLEGLLTLPGRFTCDDALYTQIFIQIGPMDASPLANESPIRSFPGACMLQPWVPPQRH